MRPFLFASAVLVHFAAAPTVADDAADLKSLQGKWTLMSATHDGEKVPEKAIANAGLMFERRMVTLIEGDNKKTGKVNLDTNKSPHQIDIVAQGGPEKGKTIRGIYELKGDTLRLCFGLPDAKRPTAFASKKGDEAILAEFKRDKK